MSETTGYVKIMCQGEGRSKKVFVFLGPPSHPTQNKIEILYWSQLIRRIFALSVFFFLWVWQTSKKDR
jgi:hypothetical protein